jgi:hypothetical protein
MPPKTSYGYVEREADSYVNWADVGRTMTSTIDTIFQEREDKKTFLEETYRDELEYIMENPSGENESLRNWSLNYSNTAAESLKLKNQLFKQGKVNLNDYVKFRQNITDNTENMYKTINDVQTIFKDKMDRFKAGDSQELEPWLMEELEKYGNLSNTKAYVNPLTGAVSIALTEEVEENGQKIRKASKDPGKLLTVNQLRAAANVKYDNYNPLKDIEAWVNTNGEIIQNIHQIGADMNVGSITELKDVTWNEILAEYTAQERPAAEIARAEASFKKFKESEDYFAQSLTANKFNELAILTNQKKFAPNKLQYKFTYDPKEKGDNVILMEKNPDGTMNPLLTPEQRNEAKNYIKTLAYAMYDKTKKTTTYTGPQTPRPERANQPQEWLYKVNQGKKDVQAQNDIIREAISHPDPRVRESRITQIQQMEGVDGNNTGVDAETGEFVVTPKDKDKPAIVNKVLRLENGVWVSNEGGEGYMSDKDFAAAVVLMSNPKTSMSNLEEYYNLTEAKSSQWDSFSPEMAIDKINEQYDEEYAGIKDSISELKPFEKLEILKKLQKRRDELIKYQEERKSKGKSKTTITGGKQR